jgi:PD-(D/E)XK nuclease superfamily
MATPSKKSKLYTPGQEALFPLSRSKVELFQQCRRCFYLDRRLGISRPPGFPFSLNSAVDALLKKEFDVHRENATPHPLMTAAGIDAVPFQHPEIEIWRSNFKGIRIPHAASGFELFGAVDDIWQERGTGRLLVVDYKATAKDTEVSLDAEWQDGYKRQVEFYQWLLRQKGFEVSPTAWFVYVNGCKDRPGFDAKLEFRISLLPHEGNTDWIEETVLEARRVLDQERAPERDPACPFCSFVTDSAQVQ